MAQIGKFTRVWIDDSGGTPVNISTHVTEFSGIPKTYDELESSGFTEDKNYTLGQGDSDISMKVKFNSTTFALFLHATTGAVGSNTARTLTQDLGNNATPTTGDPTVTVEVICSEAVPETAKDGLQMIALKFKIGPGAAIPAWSTL